MFDRTGKPVGERDVDQSIGFGVTRNTYSAHSKFSENTQADKVVDRSGKPEERNSSNAQIRTLLDEQRQMIIAEYCEKIGHHELQAAHAEEERRILREELWRQQMDFREAHQQSLTEMEQLRKFQSSTFDTIARRKFVEDQNTILELSGPVQELQNEVNCMNDSKDFQDAESVRSGNSHVTSRPVSFPPHPIPEGMLRPSFISPSRREGPPSIWDTHGISGNVFANPHASSSAPYPQELNQWGTTTEEPLHTVEKSERPEQNQDLRCQSGPSAKDSVIFSGGDSSNNYGADQQRLQISDIHFDKFPTPATFACWKIRFKTEVRTCSQFPTEAMQWIKEVELVDSVDELRSSSSTRGISMPNFEVLDARIASALNKIIHNSHFKRRISLEEQKAQKQDRFLRGRPIAYLIYDYFRVTGSHDSVENYTDLFTVVLRNDDLQEFDSKWDGILLSMTKIPSDDILEGLYKLRIRESDQLNTVLELYDLEIHQKKLGPDYHRLKTMVKRSFEQEVRNKNFGSAVAPSWHGWPCQRCGEHRHASQDPELHHAQLWTTQKDGTPPSPRRNAHSRTLYSAWSLLLDAQSSCVVLLVVLGLVRCLRWKMGTKLGRSQLHARPVEIFPRPSVTLSNTSPAMYRRSSVVSWSDSLTARAGRYGPLCAQRAGATFFWFSFLQVSTPLSLVGLLAHFLLCKAYRALIVSKLMDSAEWSR